MQRLLVVIVAWAAAACTSTGLFYDPVFLGVGEPRAAVGPCTNGSTCVEVPLTAIPEAAGDTGHCELYETPGDPATTAPLVAQDIEVPAASGDESEVPIVWRVTVPSIIEPSSLNPVCSPMVEG